MDLNIYNFLMFISDKIWLLLIPLLLFTGALFTVKSKFVQILNFPEMIKVLKTPNTSIDGISGLQAFFVGLASRVGTGNIAGVASAIAVGGPGAVFWMWIVALFGAASAFVESTLAQLYKVHDSETKYRGGPAYYISNGLNNKTLAIIFAFVLAFPFGLIFCAVQANTISTSFKIFFSDTSPLLLTIGNSDILKLSIIIAIFLTILLAVILFFGANAIVKLSSVMVPVMAGMYIGLTFLIIILNFSLIPSLFGLIISYAFTPHALAGGVVGFGINQGVRRGVFSNEAGMGTAPNAAASADIKHPVTQGLIQSLGVFVDTLLVCTATAFIILLPVLKDPKIGYTYMNLDDGITITQTALLSNLGIFSVYFLTIAVFFFAFSSILGFYFYAQSNIEYLSNKKYILNIYKFLLLIIVVFGSISSSKLIWSLTDLFMGITALINIYAILLLHPKAILLLKDYRKQRLQKREPEFNSNNYDEFKEFEIWKK